MDAYTGFAQVYDLFMDNIPYEEWGTYVKGLLWIMCPMMNGVHIFVRH